jgi:hypothetical protein
METFLREKDFRILNRAALERERGIRPLIAVNIVALDADLRMITVNSVPGRYVIVKLTSAPPTRHSTDLEDSLQRFIVEGLRCEIRRVTRSENDSGTRPLFESEVGRVKDLFLQDERAKGQRRP